MGRDEVLSYLKAHKQEFKERYGVEEMALFGSYARDEATIKSDIDLLVKMPSGFDNFFNLKEQLYKELGKEIDLGFFDSLRIFIKKKIQNELIYV